MSRPGPLVRYTVYHRASGCPHLHVRREYERAPLPSSGITVVDLCLDCGNAICVVVEPEDSPHA